MIHRCKRQPDRQLDAQSGSDGSKVAASPSTRGDAIAAAHHRTTGEPGQGVDGRLLCPVINKPGPNPPPGGLSGGIAAAAKGLFSDGGRMNSSSDDERSNPRKVETTLVT